MRGVGDPRHPAAAYLFGCAFGLKEFSTNGTIGCKLDISKDGKTAYLAMRVEKDLMATTVDVENPRKIGKVSVYLMSTVDLTKEIPEVTNVTFAQRFTEKVDL